VAEHFYEWREKYFFVEDKRNYLNLAINGFNPLEVHLLLLLF